MMPMNVMVIGALLLIGWFFSLQSSEEKAKQLLWELTQEYDEWQLIDKEFYQVTTAFNVMRKLTNDFTQEANPKDPDYRRVVRVLKQRPFIYMEHVTAWHGLEAIVGDFANWINQNIIDADSPWEIGSWEREHIPSFPTEGWYQFRPVRV